MDPTWWNAGPGELTSDRDREAPSRSVARTCGSCGRRVWADRGEPYQLVVVCARCQLLERLKTRKAV
jgi:hypothetical protein